MIGGKGCTNLVLARLQLHLLTAIYSTSDKESMFINQNKQLESPRKNGVIRNKPSPI